MSNFDKAMARVGLHEGGYANRNPKNDPGGETNHGITWRALAVAIRDGIVPPVTVKALTKEQAKKIFKHYYWDSFQADKLPFAIAYQIFDFGVNSGVGRAVRYAQTLVNDLNGGPDMLVDGKVGPKTIRGLSSVRMTSFLKHYLDDRWKFMQSLSNFQANKNGWKRRIDENREYAKEDTYVAQD